MRLSIELDLGNAVFEVNPVDEVQRILQGAVDADLLAGGEASVTLRDVNGSRVGTASVLNFKE